MAIVREHWWMATPDEQTQIVSVIQLAEARSSDRGGQKMAITYDLKIKPLVYAKNREILELVRYRYAP